MDFHTENWEKLVPLNSRLDMETIATLYELLAMADGAKLPAGTSDAKTTQNSSFQ